jgi:hypothetical protein
MRAGAGRPLRRICKHVSLLCLLPLVVAGCAPNGPPVGQNAAPVAIAGADQTVEAGASVTLDGSASTGGSLSFSWQQLLGTPVALSSTSSPTLTFTAPANGTTLVFELTVSNARGDSTSTVHVSVHPVEQSAQVTEVRQRSVTDDPAVAGNFPDGWTPPGPTPGPPPEPAEITEGGPELIQHLQYATPVDVDLAPGAAKQVELQLSGASILFGAVRWIGTTDSLPVTIALDGTTLATGTGYSFAGTRGGSRAGARTTGGGLATLSVTNTSGVTVKVRMIFGALAL